MDKVLTHSDLDSSLLHYHCSCLKHKNTSKINCDSIGSEHIKAHHFSSITMEILSFLNVNMVLLFYLSFCFGLEANYLPCISASGMGLSQILSPFVNFIILALFLFSSVYAKSYRWRSNPWCEFSHSGLFFCQCSLIISLYEFTKMFICMQVDLHLYKSYDSLKGNWGLSSTSRIKQFFFIIKQNDINQKFQKPQLAYGVCSYIKTV